MNKVHYSLTWSSRLLLPWWTKGSPFAVSELLRHWNWILFYKHKKRNWFLKIVFFFYSDLDSELPTELWTRFTIHQLEVKVSLAFYFCLDGPREVHSKLASGSSTGTGFSMNTLAMQYLIFNYIFVVLIFLNHWLRFWVANRTMNKFHYSSSWSEGACCLLLLPWWAKGGPFKMKELPKHWDWILYEHIRNVFLEN